MKTLTPILVLFVIGCGKALPVPQSYVAPEPTEEDRELIEEYSVFRDAILDALGRDGDYVQIAVVDRETSYPDDDETYTRVLILQREVLDLDDYGFSPPGRESSEEDADFIEGFSTEVMFWVDKEGAFVVDYTREPPGMHLVTEWCVPNSAGEKVSLHFGGSPCLTLQLTSE